MSISPNVVILTADEFHREKAAAFQEGDLRHPGKIR